MLGWFYIFYLLSGKTNGFIHISEVICYVFHLIHRAAIKYKKYEIVDFNVSTRSLSHFSKEGEAMGFAIGFWNMSSGFMNSSKGIINKYKHPNKTPFFFNKLISHKY